MPSSVIQWMRYEPHLRSLLIAFRGRGDVYRYFDVPASAWEAFLAATSKGTHLNTLFKDGGYGYERIARTPGQRPGSRESSVFWGEFEEFD